MLQILTCINLIVISLFLDEVSIDGLYFEKKREDNIISDKKTMVRRLNWYELCTKAK